MKKHLIVFALFASWSLPLRAQYQPPTQAQCDSAQVLVRGQRLPPVGDSTWGLWYALSSCGDQGARAAAAALASSSLATETDSLRLVQFFTVYWALKSPDLYTIYTSIARSGAASVQLRLLAVTALGKQTAPVYNFTAADYADPGNAFCHISGDNLSSTSTESPMPAGYSASIFATMKAIETDLTAPPALRGAGHCWRVALSEFQPFDPATLTLTYVCGNRFRISNPNTRSVAVTFQSVAASVATSTTRQIQASAFGDTNIEMAVRSTIRLFYNGVLIQTAANGGTACPSP